MQFGGQAQVAQHQTRLRRKAVQQLLLHRRQSLTLAFLDDEYAQQLTAVPDGPDVPARHRSDRRMSSGGAGGSPSLSGWTAASLIRPPASSHTWTRRAPTPAARTFAIHAGVSCADAPLSGAKWASTSYGSGCGRPDRRFAHARSLLRTGSNPTATIAVATTDSSGLGASERPTKPAHDDHHRDVDRADERDQTGQYEEMLPQASASERPPPSARPPTAHLNSLLAVARSG